LSQHLRFNYSLTCVLCQSTDLLDYFKLLMTLQMDGQC